MFSRTCGDSGHTAGGRHSRGNVTLYRMGSWWAFCCAVPLMAAAAGDVVVSLPDGVRAVWDLETAHREGTGTRERICINGLWRWQPVDDLSDEAPATGWGNFKVPGCWPGITDYMQKDCQTVFLHPDWRGRRLAGVTAAWYQREVTAPAAWAGRRILLQAEYLNSFATVLIDGRHVGELRYPGGELDVTDACRPGARHLLSLGVAALPLQGVMLSYSDSAAAREVQGHVPRRGLCGDVYLSSVPDGPQVGDVRVETSVRQGTLTVDAALDGLAAGTDYLLRIRVLDGETTVQELTRGPFQRRALRAGRLTLVEPWQPERQELWDTHTPGNQFTLQVELCSAHGDVLDAALPVRFGFREFWIEGRDFYLNGTRIFLAAVPLDSAQVGAAWATYDAARETMERLQSFGINFVYTHNYGCEPGSHLSFTEILRAADDVGMLVALSQPHFAHYDWSDPDAERTNGYAQHAAFYARAAQHHPAVVAYSTSHNATGYAEDMNPDMIDGRQDRRDEWSQRNVTQALRAAAIIQQLDPSRVIYHHASGNLGPMHTVNFYANFVPIQEMSDWFEHWSRQGVKPVFTCEYTTPMPWDWTMYRGWYQGKREFGSAVVPWEFCVAEWNAQFVGDRAYQISQEEKANLRWEAEQYRDGRRWHRWDYPHQVGSSDFAERYPVYAQYFAANWPAFRLWEVSAVSPWNHAHYWTLRPGVDRRRRELPVDWQTLQRPGFSPDYLADRYETIELAYERSDWVSTVAAETLIRFNRPLLACLVGKPDAPTSRDHVFMPGETVEKQLMVVNNSRESVTCRCAWTLALPHPLTGTSEVTVPTGQQHLTPLRFALPTDLPPGPYALRTAVHFSTGEVQEDSFTLDVLPHPQPAAATGQVMLFDPVGQTRSWLEAHRIPFRTVTADAQLTAADLLVVGKGALTVHGAAPQITPVRDGLRVVLFEQTPEVLEKRFGLRVATYGLREVFRRVPDHPILAGLDDAHLRDWRGEATLVPPRLEYTLGTLFSGAPTVRWCGIPVSHAWRCGNRGNVASALIEKPARGDFLPLLDGGYALQYSPLLEYREGTGLVLFCQLDVTGRTADDPAADLLAQRILEYAAAWQPSPQRSAVYVGDAAWQRHLESLGVHAQAFGDDGPGEQDVLIVGPGGGARLRPHAATIRCWLDTGGQVLALGLDQEEARAFLPLAVRTSRAEHIATYFTVADRASLLTGVSPADVHCAAPLELPLIESDDQSPVRPIGDGVLALADHPRVVFCQLPPESVNPAVGSFGAEHHNLKRTYRRTCFLITRLLGNLGVAGSTPLLTRFSTPVPQLDGASIVRDGAFQSDVAADGVPDAWSFSSDGDGASCRREARPDDKPGWSLTLAGPPADSGDSALATTMLAQHDVAVRQGQWYRISFRARAERLAAGSVALTIMNTVTWKPFFDYQRFQPGSEWEQYQFEVQSNDVADRRTRFQVWFSGAGQLWLTDLEMTPIPDPARGRWEEGLYLDVPDEWDDPYRFFRW